MCYKQSMCGHICWKIFLNKNVSSFNDLTLKYQIAADSRLQKLFSTKPKMRWIAQWVKEQKVY